MTQSHGKKWTGFAHGNSGIIFSLSLMNDIFNDGDIEKLILKALKYEEMFKINDGWKGVDVHDRDTDFNSWCHGATGIFYTRKTMLNEHSYKNKNIISLIEKDIEHYSKTKKLRGINNHPSLCHGAYGNAIIDPENYLEYLNIDCTSYSKAEDKSLMHGRSGAVYADLLLNRLDKDIPNILLLK